MEAVLLTVTLLSLTIAICTSVLAWRVMRHERLRSEARIAALTADLAVVEEHGTVRADRPQAPPVATDLPIHREAVATPPVVGEAVEAPQGMFVPGERGRSLSRVAAGVCAAALIVAFVIGSLVWTSDGTRSTASTRRSEPVAPAAAAAAPLPLELIALGHEREADRLTVRGVVRGSAPDGEKGPLTAVVLLFNRDGNFIASGRAEVQHGAADPAGERTFVVTVPSAGDVGRYRVSFRTDDHIVPHVDRRTQAGQLKPEAESGKSQI
jgi:hypothetical protein